MITPLADWSWDVQAGVIRLAPRRRPATCAIQYRERVRPLGSAREILMGPVAGTPVRASTVESLVTGEGEYGHLVTVEARVQGRPLFYAVGCVLLDDAYALLVGVTIVAGELGALRARVRDLLLADRHRLDLRPRRFRLCAPAGWRAEPPGMFHQRWRPEEADGCEILVGAATPREAARSPAEIVRRVLEAGGLPRVDQAAAKPVSLLLPGPALSGRLWRVTLDGASADVAVLEDRLHAYPLLLRGPAPRVGVHRGVFRDVIESVEHLPEDRSATTARPLAACAMWAT